MRNFKTMFTLAAATTAVAGYLMGGGFYLQLGNPDANPDARKANAVLVVKATGCHDPATAQLTARAIGTVDGKRQTIPLNVIKLPGDGVFALSQQWPSEGKWIIELTATNGEQFTNTLIAAGPDGLDRLHAKAAMKAFAPSDLEAMLH
jgi:hypothetical protein